ncbi:MAG: GFA family protein [Burkholderiales bacterium]|jgi:hypothetical protein
METVHPGGCLCGELRLSAHGAPLRVNACHCTFCQRMTGTAFHTGVTFARDAVRFEGTTPKVYEHVSDGSGHSVFIHSCPRCATNVALTLSRWPEVCAVLRGAFDDPDRFPPERHMYLRSAQRGTLLPAATECYAGFRVDLDGAPLPATTFDVPMVAGGRGRPPEPAAGTRGPGTSGQS